MHPSLKRFLGAVLSVLAVAAIAYVVRGAVAQESASTATALPPGVFDPGAGATPFRVGAAARNVIPEGATTIATTRERAVLVYAKPGAKRFRRLAQRRFNSQQIPLTFRVRYRRPGWVKVDLPTRPNQSKGWVRRKDVDLTFTKMRIEVEPKRFRIVVYDGTRVVDRAKIAVGLSLSPTPPGRYYVTDIVRATNPDGFYGPYALGLSAHSNVYTSFNGGNGQIGIHGTNQPSVLGTNVSAGCVRVGNAIIRRLAQSVPLGTPVIIRA